MKNGVFNPYLPLTEYVPDGEPHVFEGRLYVYGSHDRFNGATYCELPYVGYSCPLDDLGNFAYHGVIYDGKEDPLNPTGDMTMFAPDVAFYQGRYYLYYGLSSSDSISIAVSAHPYGPFHFYGHVQHPDGTIWGRKPGDGQPFDPGIFVDEDGRIYLYSGFSTTPQVKERILKRIPQAQRTSIPLNCDGSRMAELQPDMKTIKRVVHPIIPGVQNSAGTGFEGHEFFEASSMRKFEGLYYLIYSSVQGHELCYGISDRPDGGFTYGGILHDNADLGLFDEPQYYHGNNHGSLIDLNGQYYVFGHRHTNYSSFSRQGVADPITRREDGRFQQAVRTSYGLYGRPLEAEGRVPASIACVLKSRCGAVRSDVKIDRTVHPAVTEIHGKSCITHILDGTVIGYRTFEVKKKKHICAKVQAQGEGCFLVRKEEQGEVLARIPVSTGVSTEVLPCGIMDLYLEYQGEGSVDLFEIGFE